MIRFGAGVAILAIILWRFDARPALRVLAREQLRWFLSATALYLTGLVLSAWRWQVLTAILGVRSRFLDCLTYYFVGAFTNLFAPGLVGGDAARAFYLGRKTHRMGEAIASTMADRGYGLLALFWLAAAIAATPAASALPARVRTPTVAIGALTFLAFVASPLIARMIHLAPRPIRRALGIVAPYLHHPVRLALPIALSLALQILIAAGQWMIAIGLGLDAPLSIFLVIVPIANVFASMPVTLGGLGVRETAYIFLFGMAGIGHNDAIALGLLWFTVTTIAGLTGAIAFLTTDLPPIRGEAEAKIEEAAATGV